MTSTHTLDHMRKEYFMGKGITDKKSRDQWANDGAKDARARAREIAKAIIAGKEKSYIPQEIDRLIRKKFNILL